MFLIIQDSIYHQVPLEDKVSFSWHLIQLQCDRCNRPHGHFCAPGWRSHTMFVQTDHKETSTTHPPQHKPLKYLANWRWDGVYCLPLLTSRLFSNFPAFVIQHSAQTPEDTCNCLNNWDHVERDRAQDSWDWGLLCLFRRMTVMQSRKDNKHGTYLNVW